MPELGEIKRARDIGYKGYGRYIWKACESCGKPRWVLMINNKPQPRTRVCRACSLGKLHRGIGNPNWKGGRTHHPEGYTLVKRPDHPYCYRTGYVLEHRLVMESLLGRYLLPTEIVGFKDGDRRNTAPDNLVLFQSREEFRAYYRAKKEAE